MATWYRVVATLVKESGLPEDAVQNTFHFVDAGELHQTSDLMTAVERFYNVDTAGSGTALCDLLSTTVERTGSVHSLDVYEVPLSEGPVGAPVDGSNFALQAAVSGLFPLPDETACCISLHGTLSGLPESVPGGPAGPAGDTHPRARRRGRVYIGPLGSGAVVMDADQTTAPVIGSGARTVLTAAADRLGNEVGTNASMYWAILSRTEWDMHAIEGGWVDDAIDIQRRRGVAPSTRTSFTL